MYYQRLQISKNGANPDAGAADGDGGVGLLLGVAGTRDVEADSQRHESRSYASKLHNSPFSFEHYLEGIKETFLTKKRVNTGTLCKTRR